MAWRPFSPGDAVMITDEKLQCQNEYHMNSEIQEAPGSQQTKCPSFHLWHTRFLLWLPHASLHFDKIHRIAQTKSSGLRRGSCVLAMKNGRWHKDAWNTLIKAERRGGGLWPFTLNSAADFTSAFRVGLLVFILYY